MKIESLCKYENTFLRRVMTIFLCFRYFPGFIIFGVKTALMRGLKGLFIPCWYGKSHLTRPCSRPKKPAAD